MSFFRILLATLASLLLYSNGVEAAPPTVTSLAPNFGYTPGGNVVTITGTNFLTTTAVHFGTTAAGFVVTSATTIDAVAPAHVAGQVNVFVTNTDGISTVGAGSVYTYNTVGNWFAYVTAQISNNVTPIDLQTDTAQSPIVASTASGPFGTPFAIAITPDAKFAYFVNNANTVGNVVRIDLTSNRADLAIPLTPALTSQPFDIAITPDGLRAVVVQRVTNTVSIISLITNSVIGAPIAVGSSPEGVAITPDGTKAYIINALGNSVSILSLVSNTVTGTILGFNVPVDIAITPDGTKAYVTNRGTGGNASVIVINVATNSIIGGETRALPDFPNDVAITSDGLTAYVTNDNTDTITPITVAGSVLGTPIPVPARNPFAIAITPDHQRIVSADPFSNVAYIVEIPSGTVGPNITVGSQPEGIAITPDQAPTASFVVSTAPAGSPTSFDASASSSPRGTIVSYAWNFGDGTLVTTASPTITHTYAAPGNYAVTLRVTNSAGTSTTQTFTGHTVSNNGGPSALTSQLLSIGLAPTTGAIGRVEKKKFFNKTEYVLQITFPASTSPDIAFYRIYRNGVVIQIVPAGPAGIPLATSICLDSKVVTGTFEVAAVNTSGVESPRVPITIIP